MGKIGPDHKYGPKLTEIMREYAHEIHDESSAKGVRIVCEFIYEVSKRCPEGKGNLKVTTFVTKDGRNKVNPHREARESTLVYDVFSKLKAVIKNVKKLVRR